MLYGRVSPGYYPVSLGASHRKAAEITAETYEYCVLERYGVVEDPDAAPGARA